MSEKTEQPTPRRLRRAREAGESAVSSALGQAIALVCVVLLAANFTKALARGATALFHAALESPNTVPTRALPLLILDLSLPIVGSVAAASIAMGLLQTGGVVAPSKVLPRLDRLNFASGLRALFSPEKLRSLLRALVSALLLLWCVARILVDHAADLANSVGNVNAAVQASSVLVTKLGWAAFIVTLVMACLDWLSVQSAWLRKLRMTRHEVQLELRESEGDPHLKSERRRAHREALDVFGLVAVEDATIIIEGSSRFAIALRYIADEDRAPRIVARGSGQNAQHIILRARTFGIPVHRDAVVANALREAEIGSDLPPKLYDAVADILGNYSD